jgi:hypothetical protein
MSEPSAAAKKAAEEIWQNWWHAIITRREAFINLVTPIIQRAIEEATVARYGELINANAKLQDRIGELEAARPQPQEWLTKLISAFQEINDWALWIKEPMLRDEDKRAAKIAGICDDMINELQHSSAAHNRSLKP